jgi:hypothetical protein
MQFGAQSWLDYVTAISKALAAVGTLAAVIIALYLNIWRDRRLRPKLSLEEYEDTWFGVGFNPGRATRDSAWGIPLLVRNARGRKTAHDVQVLATFSVRLGEDQSWTDFVIDQPLVWKFGVLPSGQGTPSVDIPPGVTRKIFVAFIGEPNQIFQVLWPRKAMPGGFANDEGERFEYDESGRQVSTSPPIAGVLATYPFTQDDAFWFWRDQEYRLRLTLTSRDSDAATYEALISFAYTEQKGAVRGDAFIQPMWPEPDWISQPIDRGWASSFHSRRSGPRFHWDVLGRDPLVLA